MCDNCSTTPKLMKSIKLPMKKLNLQCECEGMEFMQWLIMEREQWDIDNDCYEQDQIYINFAGTKMYGFKAKVKAIWSIFRHGEYENYGVLLGRDNINKIKKYLNNVTKYWDTLE